MNKKHLQEQAKNLYTQGFETFKDIAKKLGISERTIRIWAKKNNWEQQKNSFVQKTDSVYADMLEIAIMLGNKIKKLLSQGKEPSAAILNAYRGIIDKLGKAKDFQDSEKKTDADTNTAQLNDLTKKALQDTFNF